MKLGHLAKNTLTEKKAQAKFVLVKKLQSVEDSNLPTQLCKKWLKTGEGDPGLPVLIR